MGIPLAQELFITLNPPCLMAFIQPSAERLRGYRYVCIYTRNLIDHCEILLWNLVDRSILARNGPENSWRFLTLGVKMRCNVP